MAINFGADGVADLDEFRVDELDDPQKIGGDVDARSGMMIDHHLIDCLPQKMHKRGFAMRLSVGFDDYTNNSSITELQR